jgi:hypothetical protein
MDGPDKAEPRPETNKQEVCEWKANPLSLNYAPLTLDYPLQYISNYDRVN